MCGHLETSMSHGHLEDSTSHGHLEADIMRPFRGFDIMSSIGRRGEGVKEKKNGGELERCTWRWCFRMSSGTIICSKEGSRWKLSERQGHMNFS
jgi:hypothetical protein